MTNGNGSLSFYLTMATVKDTEKEAFGKHCWKRGKWWIPAISSFFSNDAFYPMTDNTVHVAYSFWSTNAFNLDKSRILQYGKEFMQNCCNI